MVFVFSNCHTIYPWDSSGSIVTLYQFNILSRMSPPLHLLAHSRSKARPPPNTVLHVAGIRTAGTNCRTWNVTFFFYPSPKLRIHEAIPPVLHTTSRHEVEQTRKQRHFCVIPGCALLGYYAASSGNSLPVFRDKLSVPASRSFPTTYRCRNVGKELPLYAV
jgi:hypothetical protein